MHIMGEQCLWAEKINYSGWDPGPISGNIPSVLHRHIHVATVEVKKGDIFIPIRRVSHRSC